MRDLYPIISKDVGLSQVLSEKHTNLEIVLVGQRVRNILDLWRNRQNHIRHLVHSGLHACTVVEGECLEGNVTGRLPCAVEPADVILHLGHSLIGLPIPGCVNIGAKNTVPGWLQSGELAGVETVESRAGALENGETLNGGANGDETALAE